MKRKQSWKLIWLGACVLLFLFAFCSFQGTRDPAWGGTTMGTFYTIRLADRLRSAEIREIKAAVEERLAEVNRQMSTWDPDSEISQFNGFDSREPFPVSPEFAGVVRRALKISALTDGAFDPTVKPLVDHWGFGSAVAKGYGETGRSLREDTSLDSVMESVGWRKVSLEGGLLAKKHPAVQLDLSAIAKGYGVDSVAEVIRSFGVENFLVEIGGEVTAFGFNPDGQPWRIGIESPHPDVGGIIQVVPLSGRAMATSGDYRNFRTREDGTRFSHIIDPHTGRPSESDVASVSVLANSCMDADAVATALFVLGAEQGAAGVEQRPDLDAFFILHSTNQTFTTLSTDGFPE